MITLEQFAEGLAKRAVADGLEVRRDEKLVANAFRGREPSNVTLPSEKLGIWCGAYPVILAPLIPTQNSDFGPQTKSLHAQVLIARSYVAPRHIVDMHLFLLFQAEVVNDDQAAGIDRLERDEAICRKQVFVPGNAIEAFDEFIERTFLARPWAEQKPRTKGFQLDQPTALVQEILENEGLKTDTAEAWVRIVNAYRDGEVASPRELIDRLVAAMDENP